MTDPRRAEARRLRATERLSIPALAARLGVGRDQLREWLCDLPPPDWTRRPNAKDALREQAIELRHAGWTVPALAAQLGVARSTAYLWVRDLPLGTAAERAQQRREHSRRMTDARWEPHRRERDARQAAVQAAMATSVGELTDRDVLLVGAAIYWCEGSKSKPWRPRDWRLKFTNSDPGLLRLFLRFLELHGIDRAGPSYRVSIHESADADAATDWWATQLDLPRERFQRPTLKRHRTTTVRKNVGADYHGCLVITVSRSPEIYWRIAGVMQALAGRC